MKSAELELHAMECLLLAHEVSDPQQRRILREAGVSWLRVAEQVRKQGRPEPAEAAFAFPSLPQADAGCAAAGLTIISSTTKRS
jgi:hypothetical protein